MSGIVMMAIVLGAGLDARADFAQEFQQAKTRFDQKDYQAAAQAFQELAAAAPNARGEAASISFAALSLGRLKQVEQAIDMARTIKAKPTSACTQMEILSDNKKYQELIAAFKAEDVAAWPDSINYVGFFLRGGAYSITGDKRAALEDFRQCADLAGSDVWVKLEALNNLAALCHDLGDDARAMETYQAALAVYEDDPGRKGRWLYPQTLLGTAHILTSQRKYDEASALLARFGDTSDSSRRNVWGFLVLEAYGDVFAAQGRKADALAKY
jgi:tetratricopeptide (TPR) repeat protein